MRVEFISVAVVFTVFAILIIGCLLCDHYSATSQITIDTAENNNAPPPIKIEIKHSLSRLNSTANGKVSAQRKSETIAAGAATISAGAAYAAAIMQMSTTTENVKTIMDVTSMQTGNSFFMSILYHNLRLVRRILRNYGKIDKTP